MTYLAHVKLFVFTIFFLLNPRVVLSFVLECRTGAHERPMYMYILLFRKCI